MEVREIVDRHGGFVTGGNPQGAMADFTPEALQAFGALGVRPPRGANAYEVVSERDEGDQRVYDVKYSNASQESTTIRSWWAQTGDEWKIVKAEGAS